MKYIHTVKILVVAVLALSGCMTEYDKHCPDTSATNVSLRFSLKDKFGAQVFRANIDRTDLVLFDGAGNYHSDYSFPTSSLDANQCVHLNLAPGTYQVVAWSNLLGRVDMCSISSITAVTDGTVTCSSAASGDPLYYAAHSSLTRIHNPGQLLHTFTVPATGTLNETIEFIHAHKKLDIYVEGYLVGGQLPVLEVDGNKVGYDFYMNHLSGSTICFNQPTTNVTTPSGLMANAVFYTSRVKTGSPVVINVLRPTDGALEYSVTLDDVLATMPTFDLDTEITIPIYIRFFNGAFQVAMAPWTTEPSKPEL